ncbi:MAG: RNA polymerase sigma factor [Lentisphaeria bacterium]|nr:RNA polymerase sigma factor [Lentisphaeria bacterium]
MNEKYAIALCVRHRDPAGFEFLVRQYRREAFCHAVALLGNVQDAEDACQECFARAYRALPGLPGLERFYPWFYRILRNHCLNALERRGTQERNRSEVERRCAPAAIPRPQADLDRDERQGQIWAALDRIEAEQREILVLKYLDGLTYRDIALRLGIPRGTVMSRLYHARRAFRREFRRREIPAMEGVCR